MKIKHENGMVTFLMRTGKDFVRGQMSIGYAQNKINLAKEIVEEDNQIIVDDKYFFPVAVEPKSRKKQTEGDAE